MISTHNWPDEITVDDLFAPETKKTASPERIARYQRRRARNDRYKEANPERLRESRLKSVPKIKDWKRQNKQAVREQKALENTNKYHRPFVAIDSEGMDIPGDDILVPHGAVDKYGDPIEPLDTIYPEHRTILWGAKGWQRKHSASFLQNIPHKSPLYTVGKSTSEHWRGTPEKIQLNSLEILEYLSGLPEKFGQKNGCPRTVNFVAFSFGYDITQILKDLPYETVYEIVLKKIYDTKKDIGESPVYYKNYAIKYQKKQYIQIWRLKDGEPPRVPELDKDGCVKTWEDGNEKTKLNSEAYIKIDDVFGFYQESFVRAISSLVQHGYLSKSDYDIIVREKALRDQFENLPFETIEHYCGLELDALSKACTLLRDGFDKMDPPVHPSDWTGAGAPTGEFIKKLGLKDKHYSPDIAAKDLSPQQRRAHRAFFGGNINLLKQGYAKDQTLHSYDLAAAYPAALARLPSMKGGEWEHRDRIEVRDFEKSRANMLSMYRVRWNFDHESADGRPIPFYPFPYRTERGMILFPNMGYSWLMRDEVLAGIRWFQKFFPNRPINRCMLIEQHSLFHPANDKKPYEFLYDMYEDRKTKKQAGDIAEKCLKLIMVTLYGKTVQSVGRVGEIPSSVCPYYGAAITAWCRAELLKAALTAPYDIVSFMTDGIMSAKPLDHSYFGERLKPEGSPGVRLGDWEYKQVRNGFFIQPGVYTYEERDGSAGKMKRKGRSRGFDPHKTLLKIDMMDFCRAHVLPKWKEPIEVNPEDENDLIPPKFSYKIRRYVSAGEACASRERFKLIGRWADVWRNLEISAPGEKRYFSPSEDWAVYPPVLDGEMLKLNSMKDLRIPSIKTLKEIERWYGIPAKDMLECLKAGEPLRCRFLIPTLAIENPTPGKLSAPSVPGWVEKGEVDETALENSLDVRVVLQEIQAILDKSELRTKESWLKLRQRVKYYQRDDSMQALLRPFVDLTVQGGYNVGVWIYLQREVKALSKRFPPLLSSAYAAREDDDPTLDPTLFSDDKNDLDTAEAMCG